MEVITFSKCLYVLCVSLRVPSVFMDVTKDKMVVIGLKILAQLVKNQRFKRFYYHINNTSMLTKLSEKYETMKYFTMFCTPPPCTGVWFLCEESF